MSSHAGAPRLCQDGCDPAVTTLESALAVQDYFLLSKAGNIRSFMDKLMPLRFLFPFFFYFQREGCSFQLCSIFPSLSILIPP